MCQEPSDHYTASELVSPLPSPAEAPDSHLEPRLQDMKWKKTSSVYHRPTCEPKRGRLWGSDKKHLFCVAGAKALPGPPPLCPGGRHGAQEDAHGCWSQEQAGFESALCTVHPGLRYWGECPPRVDVCPVKSRAAELGTSWEGSGSLAAEGRKAN